MIQGSITDSAVVSQVRDAAQKFERVLVFLDSNHTHEHMLAELQRYARLVSVRSYRVVFDTVAEHMPKAFFPDWPRGSDNNPKTAVHAWLPLNPDFAIDHHIADKLVLTVARDGYLKRLK